jgi:neutral ceramidase
MIIAGAACVDITPPYGLLMAGYAARTEPSIGMHDPLTVRAVVVNDTAVVSVDVVGLHEEMTARIRKRCKLPDDSVIVAAVHTHGAPVSMRGRLGAVADSAFLRRIEDGAVEAIDIALARSRPAQIMAGMGADPDVARNRRHDDGPLDRSLPVVRIRDEAGDCIAVIASYACHPVVLGADNRLLTADYPHYVRERLEAAHPGAVAVFLTGCTGDANNGHPAHASWTLAANAERTFATAEQLGGRIAEAALAAPEQQQGKEIRAANADVVLSLTRLEQEPLPELAQRWRGELASADPVRATILGCWIDWAERFDGVAPGQWTGRVTVLDWGGVPIVALPGEIFAETGLSIREACAGRPALIVSYAEGTPGYIPPVSEFAFGGYEVEEAHRFFGMPGTFAPGSAEALAETARKLVVASARGG